MRSHRRNGFAVWLALLAAFATHCSSSSKTEKAPACAAGQTNRCVGPRGCDGAQICNADGTAFTTCACIDSGFAGTSGSAGSSGPGGASGSGAASGSDGSGGSAGASGADGAAGASGGSGLGGAAGSADASASDAMSGSGGRGGSSATGGSGGVSGTGGRGGTSGANGSAGASGSGGRGGSAGVGGSAVGGSAGVAPDASPGCTVECTPAVTACGVAAARTCMCDHCGCQVTACTRNGGCLSVAVCALQSCTSYNDCLGTTGPCGMVYSQAPPDSQMLALALGSCLIARACPTCRSTP
jgi:hypothetical protein